MDLRELKLLYYWLHENWSIVIAFVLMALDKFYFSTILSLRLIQIVWCTGLEASRFWMNEIFTFLFPNLKCAILVSLCRGRRLPQFDGIWRWWHHSWSMLAARTVQQHPGSHHQDGAGGDGDSEETDLMAVRWGWGF